jgi:hypothetical protein
MRKEDTPHVKFYVEATFRNVHPAFKEVNGFEWEGDYRPADFGRSLFQSVIINFANYIELNISRCNRYRK